VIPAASGERLLAAVEVPEALWGLWGMHGEAREALEGLALPQARRVDGRAFVGPKGPAGSLPELWGDGAGGAALAPGSAQ